jgi:hypothetical protein
MFPRKTCCKLRHVEYGLGFALRYAISTGNVGGFALVAATPPLLAATVTGADYFAAWQHSGYSLSLPLRWSSLERTISVIFGFFYLHV